MADRYWVGGTGTWDATTTTNWSATSGGAGGASAPTLADNVIFNSASNATLYTVTVGTNAVALDVTVAGPASGNVTFSLGATAVINCYGSFTLAATGITWTPTSGSTINFLATTTGKTVTTNGVSVGITAIVFNGAGGSWTLGSAYTSTSGISVTQGTFNTGNFNVTSSGLTSTGTLTRGFVLGSSTLTLGGATPVNITQISGLTFNAGTSQIICSNNSITFNAASQTFYNVSFTGVGAGTTTINGVNTFNDLTQTSRSATGTRIISLGANQTVSGTLTLGAANTSIRRIQVQSDIIGTQRTITLNGTLAALADCDFRDIVTAGSVSRPWTGTRLGNGLGNSGITFTAAKDVYWNLAAGGSWSGTGWALSSGGAVNTNNFPLPQDRAIIENTGLNTSATVTIDLAWWIGELDLSTRSNAMTLTSGTQIPIVYKNATLSSAVTMTGTGVWNFVGQGTTQILDVNTATFVPPITIDSPNGTVQLAENTTCSSTVTLTRGTLNLANNTLTCGFFSTNNGNTRAITFGTGQINLTSNAGTVWNFNGGTGLTVTGSATVNATYSGSIGTRTFLGYATGSAVINVNITAGTDIVVMNNVGFNNINFTGFTGSVVTGIGAVGNITLGAGMTITSTAAWSMYGTSGTQLFTSNGVTLDAPMTFTGVGGTFQLQDNLTLGSTRTATLSGGTLNLNGKTLSSGLFAVNGASIKSISFASGTISISSAGTSWSATGAAFTTTGSGTISMTSASSKTFAGGGFSYATLNQGGLGTLIITGANTFKNITNSVQPCTITFPASTTTTVNDFQVSGTAGNLVTLNSSTSGTKFTLNYVT